MDYSFKEAEQSLDKLSFSNRLKSVWSLFKHTFTVIGHDEDILKPWFRLLIYNTVMVTAFFYGWLGWWFAFPLEGWMFFLSIVLFTYKYFYYNRQEVRMSWIVYETVIGNDPDYPSAVAACKPVQAQTTKLAWTDIAMAFVQKGKFAASAFLEAVKALKRVDFPTFGSPTIPHLNPIKVLIYFA